MYSNWSRLPERKSHFQTSWKTDVIVDGHCYQPENSFLPNVAQLIDKKLIKNYNLSER